VATAAACLVKEGKIKRANKVRVIRDGIVIHTGELASLKRFNDEDIQSHFPKLCIADEFLIPSMLHQAVVEKGFRQGPFNHCIATFIEANPAWLTDADFNLLKETPAFFGRKFPDDIHTPIRRRVLTELVGLTPDQVVPPEEQAPVPMVERELVAQAA